MIRSFGCARRAWLAAVLLALAAAPARAHVGSPNVFFVGTAGPWALRVIVRPPAVVPGLAEVTVRVAPGTPGMPERITVQPVQWRAGVKGAPPPDAMQPVPGEPGLYAAQLWIMTTGSYSVRVRLAGAAGDGLANVPVAAMRLARLGMQRALGAVLAALGLLLAAGLLTLVGAAVRESVLPPGEEPDARRRARARAVVAAAGVLLTFLLLGGRSWWNAVDAEYRTQLYRPDHVVAVAGADRMLRLAIDDPRWQEAERSPLLPDHGKLMHLFLMREPGLDAFAHLHPVPAGGGRFAAPLPALPPGRYTLYADIVQESGFAQTLTAAVEVPADRVRAGRLGGRRPTRTILSGSRRPWTVQGRQRLQGPQGPQRRARSRGGSS